MRIFFYILIILLLANCGNNGQQQKKNVASQSKDNSKIYKNEIHYTDQQLENFLDSIGNLSPSFFADNVSFIEDSTHRNQQQMNKVISQSDFSKLKNAIKEEDEIDRTIDIKTAKSIFGEIRVDSSFLADGKIPITFFFVRQKKRRF